MTESKELVSKIKELGFSVSARHFRKTVNGCLVAKGGNKGVPLDPNGGLTMLIALKDGRIFVSEAACSDKDKFTKEAGIRIAANRLLGKIHHRRLKKAEKPQAKKKSSPKISSEPKVATTLA